MFQQLSRRKFLKTGAAIGWGIAFSSAARAGDAKAAPSKRGKRVYIMTDMEGVAGILDSENWCKPEGRYYDLGKELLTAEVNAAIAGFARAGATEFLVADGHGHGGINPKLLDPRAELARNWSPPPYPFSLDESFGYAACVGQHAMSRTENAHLAHTGSFGVFETTINGTPVGEFGEMALCAAQLGVRYIFGAGDLAFTKEARALLPGIETAAVKHGTTSGRGDECDRDAYAKRNLAAIHSHPQRARAMIAAAAERALRRAKTDASFGILALKPPFERVTILRRQGKQPKQIGRSSHPSDGIALMNAPMKHEAVKE
ncbi:MAG: M55 family metallopeptidase [Verrucomicrobia bacterium]|nr:M55 family metallopeptidase [Verrucomicrobiota bacterium]